MITTFRWTADEVEDAIGKARLEQALSQGQKIYASAIMRSVTGPRDNPTPRKGPFHTLQGIMNAESWANKSDFRQYFDVEMTFKGREYPVNMILKLSNGSVFEEKLIGKYKAGHEITKSFPEKITVGQNEYEIYTSWLSPVLRPGDRFYIQKKDAGDPKVVQRNFNVFVGGVNMVAQYRIKPPDSEPPDGEGECTFTIGPPQQVAAPEASVMDPNATGDILADDGANGGLHFDAIRAIPTSENLYAQAWGLNYLFQHTFGNMEGEVIYKCSVDVTYPTKWEEEQEPIPGPDGNPVQQDPIPRTGTLDITYEFELDPREYSYWQINQLEVFQIDQARMENYALPGGQVTLYPNGYAPPSVELINSESVEDHVFPKETGTISFTPTEIDGGNQEPTEADAPDDTEALKAIAESQTEDPEVQNDLLIFNGETIMDDSKVVNDGPEPTEIPYPERIDDYVLYEGGQWISSMLLNKADTESYGTIYYNLLPENVNGGSDLEFDINGINTVTVHTPVVNYSSVSDDQAHNQKTVPNLQRSALILERPFTVRIPTNGQHLNEGWYPGYGDRDYAKYYRAKQVLFPFDVYNEDRSQFIPKYTWIDIPVDQLDTNFFLPVWVDEGDYQVYFRNIAENAPYDYTNQGEPDANLNLIHHMATDEVSVEVIGRVYDFEVTDIADYNWESVFRTAKGSKELRGISYWIGQQEIDGDPRGNKAIYTLPIHPGSHPLKGYKNVAIKTGYHFKFDFKTKGNMFGKQDGIRITPSFYFVSKDGKQRFPVDLYYKTNTRQFVRIGSTEDQVKRYVILNDRLRNVTTEELEDTANYKFERYGTSGSLTKWQFEKQYLEKLTKQKTPVGSYSLLLLPEQVRTFIGPKTNLPLSVDELRANAAIQKWYGEYSLPANPYVVEAGTNIAEYGRTHGGLDDKSPIFKKDGYIIVNFNVETIRDGKLSDPHLQYIDAPLMNKWKQNQWEMEGYQPLIRDSYGNLFKLEYGDVVFYHADKSSRDDFSSQVPH
ncbi:DUF5704 domain-containing protein [Paenibacillus sp. Marseille-P2973]|uniref:DUF5704 domain-containing protein n=1 Tax=Paenibacillus sp. Marseille-P2973 TaxID=1871032 RepID=UPI001FFC440E|nr:DUF5704 domain-containing protein [Paenibacillus sp. Marseille-P2973]